MAIDRIKRVTSQTDAKFRTATTLPNAVPFAWDDTLGNFIVKNPSTSVVRVINSVAASVSSNALLDQVAEGSLTNAQIKALRATAVTIVAAPGTGLVILPRWITLFLDVGANVLTESAANIDVRYVAQATPVLVTIEATGFIDQAADTLTRAIVPTDKIIAKAICENRGIELFNNGAGEYAGNVAADAVIRWKLSYDVLPTGW